MNTRVEGLTDIYNRFNDPNERSDNIGRLRAVHVAIDDAVAGSYGWDDLDLDHGFYETKLGWRYTVSESARRTVLDRLLALNHQRHSEEEAEQMLLGTSTKMTAKRSRKAKAQDSPVENGLFNEEGVES
jgi:hypothetical protein